MQIDVGFNDLVSPMPEMVSLPSILDFPSPFINCYSRESTIAEKLEAMIKLGELNSRMKDFYDIFILSQTFSFDGNTLVKAIKATFKRRDTKIPEEMPLALSDEFANDRDKNIQWKAFINRNNLKVFGFDFPQVIKTIRTFLFEPLLAAG